MSIQKAYESARESQLNFLTHLTLEIENKEPTVMFSDVIWSLAYNSLSSVSEMESYSYSGSYLLTIVSFLS